MHFDFEPRPDPFSNRHRDQIVAKWLS